MNDQVAKQRVEDERAELEARLAELTGVIEGPEFAGFDQAEKDRLTAQAAIMTAYVAELGEHLAAFD